MKSIAALVVPLAALACLAAAAAPSVPAPPTHEVMREGLLEAGPATPEQQAQQAAQQQCRQDHGRTQILSTQRVELPARNAQGNAAAWQRVRLIFRCVPD